MSREGDDESEWSPSLSTRLDPLSCSVDELAVDGRSGGMSFEDARTRRVQLSAQLAVECG